jgi:hypothetical protein
MFRRTKEDLRERIRRSLMDCRVKPGNDNGEARPADEKDDEPANSLEWLRRHCSRESRDGEWDSPARGALIGKRRPFG